MWPAHQLADAASGGQSDDRHASGGGPDLVASVESIVELIEQECQAQAPDQSRHQTSSAAIGHRWRAASRTVLPAKGR
jgi:hypothetical protein